MTERAEPVEAVVRRLLNRERAAAYLSVSVATLDALRQQGELTVVAMPDVRGHGITRVPLFDVKDLDVAIERWKSR